MKTGKNYILFAAAITFFICLQMCYGQNLFRSGIFFHHSTGENIWGPNGSSTSVIQEMTRYNTQHGYTGTNAVTLNETWFPVNYDNEWAIWHTVFEEGTPEGISGYLSSNKILTVKSCFPSSAIEEIGQPMDTLSPEYKTIYNYKWHWRHIIRVMKSHYQNFFVIWTNAPLTQAETTPNSASLSKKFCKWAKDTLAMGLDPVIGVFPNNIYVFDYFSKLTDANGYMLLQYANSSNDPHPNAQATALVAPQLVDEIFNHSIEYEHLYGIIRLDEAIPQRYSLSQNYPNPFNPVTKIKFEVPSVGNAYMRSLRLVIYDILGREAAILVNEHLSPGVYEVDWDASGFSSGIYFCVLETGDFMDVKRMALLK